MSSVVFLWCSRYFEFVMVLVVLRNCSCMVLFFVWCLEYEWCVG